MSSSRLATELDWEDGCRWGTSAVISGTLLRTPNRQRSSSRGATATALDGSDCSGVCTARTIFEVSHGRRRATMPPAARRRPDDELTLAHRADGGAELPTAPLWRALPGRVTSCTRSRANPSRRGQYGWTLRPSLLGPRGIRGGRASVPPAQMPRGRIACSTSGHEGRNEPMARSPERPYPRPDDGNAFVPDTIGQLTPLPNADAESIAEEFTRLRHGRRVGEPGSAGRGGRRRGGRALHRARRGRAASARPRGARRRARGARTRAGRAGPSWRQVGRTRRLAVTFSRSRFVRNELGGSRLAREPGGGSRAALPRSNVGPIAQLASCGRGVGRSTDAKSRAAVCPYGRTPNEAEERNAGRSRRGRARALVPSGAPSRARTASAARTTRTDRQAQAEIDVRDRGRGAAGSLRRVFLGVGIVSARRRGR